MWDMRIQDVWAIVYRMYGQLLRGGRRGEENWCLLFVLIRQGLRGGGISILSFFIFYFILNYYTTLTILFRILFRITVLLSELLHCCYTWSSGLLHAAHHSAISPLLSHGRRHQRFLLLVYHIQETQSHVLIKRQLYKRKLYTWNAEGKNPQ
jgi:hypothetical protein